METPYCHSKKTAESGRDHMLNSGKLKYCKECADVERCWDGGKNTLKSLLKEEVKKEIYRTCEQLASDIRKNKKR